ncbi:MAG: hydroxyacid dehydrogenase [Acidobacteriota bacterium]
MKILLLESLHDEAVRILEAVGEVRTAERLDAESVARDARDASAILTRGRGRIERTALESGEPLKCVARCGAGTDNIDVAAATELGLPVIFSPEGTKFAVAEHALMLAMAVGRRLTLLDREVKAGNWEVRSRLPVGSELFGKVLGIVGLGKIGNRIGELGLAFGMDVCYWSANSRNDNFTNLELDELFRVSDIVSISVALTPETMGLVDERLIALMRPTAILINTSRGEIMDEDALVRALQEERIGGAGLDVMSGEPPRADHPLFRFDNVVITPHIATITDVAYRRMCVEVAGQVAKVLAGGRPDLEFVRNPQVFNAGRV